MIVALRTSEGHGHEGGAEGIGAVGHVFHPEFFFDDACFRVLFEIPIETCGQLLFLGGVGEEITCHLPGDKCVEWQVSVIGTDDPVAPGAHVAVLIIQIPVAVGEAGDIEPVGGHAFAVMCRGEVAVDQFFIRIG